MNGGPTRTNRIACTTAAAPLHRYPRLLVGEGTNAPIGSRPKRAGTDSTVNVLSAALTVKTIRQHHTILMAILDIRNREPLCFATRTADAATSRSRTVSTAGVKISLKLVQINLIKLADEQMCTEAAMIFCLSLHLWNWIF